MPAHVSWSLCLMLDRRSRPDCLLHQPGDLEDAHLVTARDVDAVADQLVRLGRHENASHRVADPGEVARLQAGAEYDQRLAGHGSPHEPGGDLATPPLLAFPPPPDLEPPPHLP